MKPMQHALDEILDLQICNRLHNTLSCELSTPLRMRMDAKWRAILYQSFCEQLYRQTTDQFDSDL